jgi:hypothetical protein
MIGSILSSGLTVISVFMSPDGARAGPSTGPFRAGRGQFPTPPQVAKEGGRFQSAMLAFEHVTPAPQPETAAVGAQSCAWLTPHVT